MAYRGLYRHATMHIDESRFEFESALLVIDSLEICVLLLWLSIGTLQGHSGIVKGLVSSRPSKLLASSSEVAMSVLGPAWEALPKAAKALYKIAQLYKGYGV